MHPIFADRRRLQLHVVASTLVGVLLGVLVRALTGVGWTGAMAFGLPLGILAAPVSLSSWYLCRAMPLSRTSTFRIAVTSMGAAIASASLWALVGQAWWAGLVRGGAVDPGVPASGLIVLVIGLGAPAYLLSLTVHYVWQAFEDSSAAGRRALESEVAQREAELRALRAQVDPHFLFNSLNSISALIAAEPEAARRMCQLLADFLRDSLALGASGRIPLGREVALAEQYLRIEQVRFGSRLAVRASVAADSAAAPVPPLILQPLVENAVRHGIATCLEGGVIEIGARRAGDLVVVVVTNPRDADAESRGTGFGLEIVRRRLRALFGDRAALAAEPAAGTYRISLTVPIEAEEPA